ncbi:MAG: hypothetical protein DRP02_05145 [Candidatus Gerdarchaeota archaeon]|nr:MAG: hypothetical protein DRP02_05145 [Candidatus Gerdarchaeota archaeon]
MGIPGRDGKLGNSIPGVKFERKSKHRLLSDKSRAPSGGGLSGALGSDTRKHSLQNERETRNANSVLIHTNDNGNNRRNGKISLRGRRVFRPLRAAMYTAARRRSRIHNGIANKGKGKNRTENSEHTAIYHRKLRAVILLPGIIHMDNK